MDKLKQQIRQKLVANIIIDKCARSEYLIFREAWCTQERVIRFTTPFFRDMLPSAKDDSGAWKTGDLVMYETENGLSDFTVNCVFDGESVPAELVSKKSALLNVCGVSANHGRTVLKSWDLSKSCFDANKLIEEFSELIAKTIPRFEQDLQAKLEADSEFTEGEAQSITTSRYGRDPKARAACLAAHGTACMVCGIDFGKAYGPEFAGKIEVHHIVPLSEISEEYVVDPVKDLVPVCPNCHTALHSKPGGVYTIEELKAIRKKNSKAE